MLMMRLLVDKVMLVLDKLLLLSDKALLLVLLCVLLACLFIAIERMLHVGLAHERKLARLSFRQASRLDKQLQQLLQRFGGVYRHLGDMLASVQSIFSVESFVLLSLLLLLAGGTAGWLLFFSMKGVLLSGLLGGGGLYLLLRFLLLNRQMQTRLDFLPAVELFYQCYLITGGRQLRRALERCVEERRLGGGVQPVFEQLHRNLSVLGDDERSLRIFAASIGHLWGDYFVQILRVALAEGHSVADNLKELISDMRKAQRANQKERNQLLEIRIANFSPVIFLGVFIGVNWHYSPEQAYYYYVLDAAGREMLLNAVVLIAGSFAMGLFLSRRRM